MFAHHEKFPCSNEIKELPLWVPIATPTSILIIKQDHSGNNQQYNEVLDKRILAMTNQNAERQHRDWFSGLAYDLKTGDSQ